MAEMSNPVDVMGRELPYSQEAELAVIGSALTNLHSVAESVEILRPSDFYFPQNKEIFSVILDLFNENAAIDFITVSNKLSQSDKLEAVGGIAYLRNAATNVPTTRHVTYYSQIIKEKAVLRTLIKSANDISDMAYGQNDKVERIVAVNIAEHVSITDKKTVAIFNLEMPKEQIVNRIICSQALVNSNKIRTGDITGEDWEKIGAIVNRVATAPMYIDDTASITVSEIRAKCRRLKQTKNLELIVIDYLQLMQSSGRTESRQNEIAEISRSLKILAKELNIPVIALSQLSRAAESRSDKRPMLSDLRESGAIEQDADMVMFLYRDEYYNPDTEDKNLAECIVAKNRSGETGMFKLGWKGEYTKFSNVEFALKEE